MDLHDPLEVVVLVTDVLDALGVPYLLGGSVATSLIGIPRLTQDADLVADLELRHAEALVRALGDAFYADEDAIRDAIRRRASFNVVHLGTMFKVDVFVQRRDPLSQAEMARRRAVRIADDPPRDLQVASPEDLILQKLDWFRRGGGVSDRQWNDVLGVVKVCGPTLDRAYLEHWAARIDLSDLLARALAGQGPR
jgi:hypothetical protein